MRTVIHRINTEHRQIHMRILHARIFPVNQTNFRSAVFLHKQKIVRHRINMRQRPHLRLRFQISLKFQHMRFRRAVIPINRRFSLPQTFIVCDLAKQRKRMLHTQMLLMEGTELFHTGLHILRLFRIADTRALQIFRNLIAVFRIDRHDFIADALSVQRPIYCRLLPAVDQKTRTFPRNPHNVPFAATAE